MESAPISSVSLRGARRDRVWSDVIAIFGSPFNFSTGNQCLPFSSFLLTEFGRYNWGFSRRLSRIIEGIRSTGRNEINARFMSYAR